MSFEPFIWIAVIGSVLFAIKFIFKNIKRGAYFFVLALVAGIWLLRALIPNQWHELNQFIQASLIHLFR